MSERDETESYRVEQGKGAAPDPRAKMGEVPLAPSSAGVVRGPPPPDEAAAGDDREAAARERR